MDVPGSAVGGRMALPGEHGFRFFPGCYQHVPDTMARIPLPGGGNVGDRHLINVEGAVVALDEPGYAPGSPHHSRSTGSCSMPAPSPIWTISATP
jgi:uncharacterized protein with NAD-binding domain and iron-sulfur cluster